MTLGKLFEQFKPGASLQGEDKPSAGTQSGHAMWQLPPPPHPFLFALCPRAALPATAALSKEKGKGIAFQDADNPGTWRCVATERQQAALASYLPCAKSNALKWDAELWELLSIVLTFSCVSASSPVKGNIYLCKKVSGILCMGVPS